jgi:plastocyanin
MSSGSLLAKATFGLLLLIFGCLVYIIVRDHRLEQMKRAEEAVQAASSAKSPAAPAIARAEEPAPPPPPTYAPLRPRVVPPQTAPAPIREVRSSAPPVIAPARVLEDAPPAATVAAVSSSRVSQPDYAGPAGNSRGFTVSGRVFLRGTPPAEKQVALDPVCGRLHSTPLTTRHYITGEEAALANVLVYVKSGVQRVAVRPAPAVVLDQVGCEFQPYVMAVQAGQTFMVRNSDPVLHNVHALAINNKERNIAQPVRGTTTGFTFPKPEVFVRFKCDVHPWMFAYVGVIEHPWFAVTGKDGAFSLPGGLSIGQYILAAAHPKAGEVTQNITVSGAATEPIIFMLDVPETLAQVSP